MNAKLQLHVLTLAVALVGASAAIPAGAALAQEEAVEQSVEQAQPGTAAGAAKADLDQSEVRVMVSSESAHRTILVNGRRIVMPLILGTYR